MRSGKPWSRCGFAKHDKCRADQPVRSLKYCSTSMNGASAWFRSGYKPKNEWDRPQTFVCRGPASEHAALHGTTGYGFTTMLSSAASPQKARGWWWGTDIFSHRKLLCLRSTDFCIVTTYEAGVEIASGALVNALVRCTAQAMLAAAVFC